MHSHGAWPNFLQDETFQQTIDAMCAFGLSDDLPGILATLLAVLHLGQETPGSDI